MLPNAPKLLRDSIQLSVSPVAFCGQPHAERIKGVKLKVCVPETTFFVLDAIRAVFIGRQHIDLAYFA